MANVTIAGATYENVPAIQVPSGSGTASFYETKGTTYNLTGGASASVTPSEVVTGQGFSVKLTAPTGYVLSGVTVTMGGNDITSQVFTPDEAGGGGPSATQHTIYFEFSDDTNTTINAWYDDSFISDAITATTPTTYGGKTVTLAQLDGATWYEVSGDIPLNTELVDYTTVRTGYIVDSNGDIVASDAWECVTDYIQIDPSMTFSFKVSNYDNVGFYTSSKAMVRVISSEFLAETTSGGYALGTLNSSNIPSNAAYIVMPGNTYDIQNSMSLIRTA